MYIAAHSLKIGPTYLKPCGSFVTAAIISHILDHSLLNLVLHALFAPQYFNFLNLLEDQLSLSDLSTRLRCRLINHVIRQFIIC